MTATIETTTTPSFTAPEKARLKQAAAEVERLEGKLAEIENLRAVITAAEAAFVVGKLDITTAAGLLACGDVNARSSLQARLRSPVKQALKDTMQSIADLLAKADAHRVDTLAASARELESEERSGFANHGLSPDEFRPSPLLQSLRARHLRALENSKVANYTKSSLTAILIEIA